MHKEEDVGSPKDGRDIQGQDGMKPDNDSGAGPSKRSRTSTKAPKESTDSSNGSSKTKAKALPYIPLDEHHNSPVRFAEEVLGVQLWSKQKEVLEALTEYPRVAVKSGNGLGKGYSAAVAILWFIICHDPAVVLSTAPTFRQVRHVLWREVHRLFRRATFQLEGKLLDTRLELSEVRYALGLSADSDEEFQGFHGPNMLIVVDEAEGVEEVIYEAIEGVMTSENCRLLLIGNPTTMNGCFRRAFYEDRQLYQNITISALDSPNVKEGQPAIRGLASRRWVEERRKVWGEDNPIYRARVLGEFPDQAEDTLIPLSAIEAAVNKEGGPVDEAGALVIAVDVARFGSDKSVILRRRGMVVEEIKSYRNLDTMKLAGLVAASINAWEPMDVMIDEVGIGAGVVDRLKEQGYRVRGINVGTTAQDNEHYANLRAEGYWNLRQIFTDGTIVLPSDNELIGQIAALRYSFNSQGKAVIESKDEMKRRGVPSPDKADALMLAFLASKRKVRLWG